MKIKIELELDTVEDANEIDDIMEMINLVNDARTGAERVGNFGLKDAEVVPPMPKVKPARKVKDA